MEEIIQMLGDLTKEIKHWKDVTGFDTPEEVIEAINARFEKELPPGLAKSLWRLELQENIELREKLELCQK